MRFSPNHTKRTNYINKKIFPNENKTNYTDYTNGFIQLGNNYDEITSHNGRFKMQTVCFSKATRRVPMALAYSCFLFYYFLPKWRKTENLLRVICLLSDLENVSLSRCMSLTRFGFCDLSLSLCFNFFPPFLPYFLTQLFLCPWHVLWLWRATAYSSNKLTNFIAKAISTDSYVYTAIHRSIRELLFT